MKQKFGALATTAPTPAQVETSLVRRGFLNEQSLPLVLEFDADVNVPSWISRHRSELRADLHRYGALLFRSATPPDFQETVRAFSADQVDYRGGTAIRSRVSSDTYTASEYPEQLVIRQHSEFCYSNDWPMLLFFYCDVPSRVGGQTPLVDNRTLLREMPSQIRQQFAERDLLYVRGYGYNRTWQRSYETDSRAEVEEICAREGRRVEWLGDDQLRTYERRLAVTSHPVTGERVWFNYAIGFHISRMDDEIRDALSTSEQDTDSQLWPNNVLWGDGAEIDAEVINTVNDLVVEHTVQFDWQHGDVLVVDNMLCGHGRQPYQGPRRILLKMAESYAKAVGNDR
ncbi:TauD/TfdA family dioxygenase [Rugosimonospora acidiphila]|uniref:TauD/TfdA family dioxygenase n=1 Tax=Rugosimonospora acidiphila TaxID=556531 RepID=A0ABP9SNN0_9ACTN